MLHKHASACVHTHASVFANEWVGKIVGWVSVSMCVRVRARACACVRVRARACACVRVCGTSRRSSCLSSGVIPSSAKAFLTAASFNRILTASRL